MNPDPALYEDVIQVYMRLIGRESSDAAAAIAQIYANAGHHAALHAALIITRLKIEVQQKCYVPELSIYYHLLQDDSEARRLLEDAIGNSLQAWGVHDLQVQLQSWDLPLVLC